MANSYNTPRRRTPTQVTNTLPKQAAPYEYEDDYDYGEYDYQQQQVARPTRRFTPNTQRLTTAPITRPSHPSTRLPSRRAVLTTLGGIAGGALFGKIGLDVLSDLGDDIRAGQNGLIELPLVCGHNDRQSNPTVLTAYVTRDQEFRVHLVEDGGGAGRRIHYFQSPDLRPSYSDQELAHVVLELYPQMTSNGYILTLVCKMQSASWFSQARQAEFLFVDSHKGYFVPIQA